MYRVKVKDVTGEVSMGAKYQTRQDAIPSMSNIVDSEDEWVYLFSSPSNHASKYFRKEHVVSVEIVEYREF